MINKKRFVNLLKIVGLLLILMVIVFLIPMSYSRYESQGTGDANMDLAFYLLKTEYHTQNILLNEIIPSATPYTYSFEISNNDGTTRTETNLQYELSIRTTTNLPLEYELYMDEEYTSNGATNILPETGPIADDDGTYFLTMKAPKRYFYYTANETHTYQLVVYFPLEYKSYEYQDIYESVQIIVDSKQVLDTDTD